MKTSTTIPLSRLASISMLIFWMLLLIALKDLNAQNIINESYTENDHDPDFPGKRRFNAGLMGTYTSITPPPALVADGTYGLSNKFSVGVIAGTTGAQSLAGIKFNSMIFQRNHFRVVYRMVVLYYPGRDGQFLFDTSDKFIMPWMLTMGALNVEWKTKRDITWSLGMGALETHCIEGMKRYFWGKGDENKISPFDVFHTLHGSVSIPLSNRLTFRPEVIAVMKEGRLIKTGDFKVFPINPFLKVIYAF